MSKVEKYWWEGDPAERFWCEITAREDVGGDLLCPQTDGSGRRYWSYSIITSIRPGDIVFHYSTAQRAFVATVDVDKHDQAVWVWTGNPMNEFTVSLVWERKIDPEAGLPEPGPPNPFIRSFGPIPGGGEGWKSDQGKICSGRAKRGAKGHTYKFTVQSPGLEALDPHVRFY